MDSFVAIDFETASWGTACAVGVVHFENGVAIDERYTLLDPGISPRGWDRGAINVHGITPRDVVGQPRFADIWPELIHYAACYPLIAHNANFDMGVLRSELQRADLQTPTVRYGCSMALARNAWPRGHTRKLKPGEISDPARSTGPENHKLSTLSEFLKIKLDHHHALSDAIACGRITVAAVEQMGHNTLAAAYEHPKLNWGEISPERSVTSSSKW
ncbi:MAG: 3'-5' exonuclease [Solirubrobacterales bacterium]